MKVILEFNLPEDQDEYKLANSADRLNAAHWDMDQYLRAEIKYHTDMPEEERAIFIKIRDRYSEILANHDLELC